MYCITCLFCVGVLEDAQNLGVFQLGVKGNHVLKDTCHLGQDDVPANRGGQGDCEAQIDLRHSDFAHDAKDNRKDESELMEQPLSHDGRRYVLLHNRLGDASQEIKDDERASDAHKNPVDVYSHTTHPTSPEAR